MTTDAWTWGDPEQVAARREEMERRRHTACGQCTHHVVIDVDGKHLHGCAQRNRTYGRRCDQYKPEGAK